MTAGTILPGTQKTLSHYSANHGLITVTYTATWFLPKGTQVTLQTGETVTMPEHSTKADKVTTFKGQRTETLGLYLTTTEWVRLGDQLCPLCGQRLDGQL
jgi:hypothetical protein